MKFRGPKAPIDILDGPVFGGWVTSSILGIVVAGTRRTTSGSPPASTVQRVARIATCPVPGTGYPSPSHFALPKSGSRLSWSGRTALLLVLPQQHVATGILEIKLVKPAKVDSRSLH
jgi:hypothetical protein